MTVETGHANWLGFLIFGIVAGSILLIIAAAVLGKPRKPKVTLIVVGMLVTLTTLIVMGMWFGGEVFSLLMG